MTAPPSWAQAGITDVPVARAFLAALRAPDTLVLTSNDADVGYALTPQGASLRGHGVTVAANLITATPPSPELVAYHRGFGLGATRYVCPRPTSPPRPLAELMLADTDLVARLRADRSLARVLISFKSPSAARLIDALGLTPVFCDPPPDAYEAANDKLALGRAGRRHGFAALAAEPIADEATLAAAFRALAAEYGDGCILRLQRGAGGRDIHHVRTLRAARRVWRRLAARDRGALLLPYVPPARVGRNVATHGLVTADGFAPFCFTDQLLGRYDYRGGSTTAPWTPAEIAAVGAGVAGVARWFRDLGYAGAPAGIDGLLVDGPDGPRFVVLDPNARLSATTSPWAAVTVLSERAGRPLAWRFEGFRLLGGALTLDRLRRHLGNDLLAPDAVARGGVLPTMLMSRRLGPFGDNHLWALMLGHDAEHVAELRRRLRGVAVIAR